MKITFKKAVKEHKAIIKEWWHKPHVKEFWDNSASMWQNIENYLDNDIKDIFDYWLVLDGNVPYALIMTSIIDEDAPLQYQPYRDKDGITFSIDFMIGNEDYLGKGFGAITLQKFMQYCPGNVTIFLIDPSVNNKKAVRVYQKAGFIEVDRFTPDSGSFKGIEHILMQSTRYE